MVDFAGWSMPVQYASITQEHQATRHAAALFDISHMGRLRLDGRDAGRFLNGLLTRRVIDLPAGRIRYSLVTRSDGGILDDVLVYRLQPTAGAAFYWMVVNASNRQKIVDWLTSHRTADLDVELHDQTLTTAMIAVQGPRALDVAQRAISPIELAAIKYYRACWHDAGSSPLLVSRTGYTGEDGVEVVVPRAQAVDLWQKLLDAGRAEGIQVAGLGARDTLRLEAAMPLYGHELTEDITPIQAGLNFAVDLDARSFPGSEALRRAVADVQRPQRIGLKLQGKRVPRQHYRVLQAAGEVVGEVTSGTFSPTLEAPVAMAYVRPDCHEVGRELWIDIRGQTEPATVVALPFYQRN